MKNRIAFFSILIFSVYSCTSKIESAKQSLIGEWSVQEIYMSTTSPSQNTSLDDKNASGQFIITNETLDYEFSFDGENKSDSYDYQLEVSKENGGFTRVDRFDIVGEENYRVRFGDQTSDAHKNADMISLEKEVVLDSITTTYLLILEKD